jgi:hypothetical protein
MNNLKIVADGQKVTDKVMMAHGKEIGGGIPLFYVISGLWRHLAAKSVFDGELESLM